MTHVKKLIYQDARRQLFTGTALSFIALIFIIGFLTLNPSGFILSLIYSAIFTISGLGLLRTGYLDLKKARQTEDDFTEDDTEEMLERVPARMYLGQKAMKSYHAGLFAMDGELYGEIEEEVGLKQKILMGITAALSLDTVRSADFILKDKQGNLFYKVEKKGGFSWRGYVQNKKGNYVAYTKDTKKKGQQITQYIESDQWRWRAEGDTVIGHFTIKDQNGTTWAIIKRGAIPTEAVDRFEQMPGYLVEWKKRDHIPASLIAFLFLLQSRDR
ncbi:hypothetical protein SAMN05421743_101310 [Thalassobacillus cyri]|uniref:Uncharacterized protein n=1 Tax=Thalassobacillus cyri TaxID=571932 RepID=A0A1H3W5U0_9BACI|nr:hypothetical protein [Thalassobacillus cyri]SDZ81794.1 hypothetical protein SAMN05421743_101310 [Thalassobacillus cyri]